MCPQKPWHTPAIGLPEKTAIQVSLPRPVPDPCSSSVREDGTYKVLPVPCFLLSRCLQDKMQSLLTLKQKSCISRTKEQAKGTRAGVVLKTSPQNGQCTVDLNKGPETGTGQREGEAGRHPPRGVGWGVESCVYGLDLWEDSSGRDRASEVEAQTLEPWGTWLVPKALEENREHQPKGFTVPGNGDGGAAGRWVPRAGRGGVQSQVQQKCRR